MIEEKDRVKKEKKRKDPTFVEARDFHQVVFENIDLTAQFEDPETHEILSKQVLQNVSGKAQSGQILGIIGNSGKDYLFMLFSSLISNKVPAKHLCCVFYVAKFLLNEERKPQAIY